MQNERPICHRAEDLVTYLYGEATAEEARDFTVHMRQCDACRAEFNVFNQVHESIVTWRNEALGPITSPARAQENISVVSPEIVQHGRRLPALAALREFFSVSPLWLRGATALAGLLFCALLVFAVSRMWQQPASNGKEAKYSQEQFQKEVERQVAERVAKLNQTQPNQNPPPQVVREYAGTSEPPTHVATDRNRPRTQPRNRLTREERVQLAADLGLIQGREEETPFVLPDEPNQ
jgi:C4-dicarboxylate-specific signal transduction histidine kinase